MSFHTLTVRQVLDRLRLDPSQWSALLEALDERIRRVDSKVKAYIKYDRNRIAKNIPPPDAQKPLWGLPVSLKDNICTHGWETTCASAILEGFIPPYDATVVAKLKEKGAFIFSKCDMDEFAFGSSCESSAYGRGVLKGKAAGEPVANPWDLERVPGGSSGGSAACVAADEAICALGSDTGGSIRQPAAFCGIVGMKPTYGRVSRYGLVAFGSSLDQIGPLTKTVEDNALLLEAIAGYDERDSTCVNRLVPKYTQSLAKDVKGLRVGIPKEYFIAGLNSEVEEAVRKAVDRLRQLGAVVKDISLPHTRYAVPVYYVVAVAEASSNLARFDGVQYGLRKSSGDLLQMYLATRSQGFGDEAKRRILLGTFALSAGYYDAYYLRAQKVRTLIKQDFSDAFQEVDVIACPTSPTPAFRIGEKVGDPLSMYLSDIYTIPANLAGIPAMSIPCGLTSEGLPIGLQLMGNYFEEETLYRMAYTFEQATDHHKRRPRL